MSEIVKATVECPQSSVGGRESAVLDNPAVSEFLESIELIGSNLWGLFSSAPLSTQASSFLKIGTESYTFRHQLISLLKSSEIEQLLALVNAAEPRLLDHVGVDFFYNIAKKLNKAFSIEKYSQLMRPILKFYGYNSTFIKIYHSGERDAQEVETLAKFVREWTTEEDSLGKASRQFLAKLLLFGIEKFIQQGKFEESSSLLLKGAADIKASEMVDSQKALSKALFAQLQVLLAKGEEEAPLKNTILVFRTAGFEFNVFIFNKILDLISKHTQNSEIDGFILGTMAELNITPNLVTYNTIMDHLCARGHFPRAYALFESLGSKGVEPDNFTFSILIKGIKNMKDSNVETADKFLEMYQQMFEYKDIIIYNSVIDVYISFGYIDKAHAIYEKMTQLEVVPDQITFNTLIKGTCKMKDFEHAVQYFHDMKKFLLRPNRITYNSLMDLAVKIQDMSKALYFVEQMQADEISPDGYTYSILLNGLKLNNSSKALVEASLSNILRVIETNEIKVDEVFFNSILDVCSKYEFYDKLKFFYGLMKQKKVAESAVTYGILIKSFGKIGDFDSAYAVFDKMIKSNMPLNEITYGCILDACSKTGNMNDAVKIYDSLKNSKMNLNSIVFTTIMKGFLKTDQYDEALAFFESIKCHKNLTGMLITFNCALDCFVRKGDIPSAIKLFKEIDSTFGADLVSYSTIIKGICSGPNKVDALEYVKKMLNTPIESDISVVNLFLDSCANQQDFKLAISAYQYVMGKNIVPNEITFGVMIKVFGYSREIHKAFDLLDLMSVYKINPSIVIYTNLIHISFYNKNPKKAETAFAIYKKGGARGDKLMYSKLIDGLLRYSELSRVIKYLDEAIRDECSLRPDSFQKLKEAGKGNPAIETRLAQLAAFEKNDKNSKMTANKDRFKNNYTQENTKKFKQLIREEQSKNPIENSKPKRNKSKELDIKDAPILRLSAEKQVNPVQNGEPKKESETKKPLVMFNFRKRIMQ